MKINFTNTTRTPSHRSWFLSQGCLLLTFGSCTYLVSGSFDIDVLSQTRPKNILIGNYSSLSWGIDITIGLNHVYKKSFSTYSFHSTGAKYHLASYLENCPAVDQFSPKQTNNHFQLIIGNDVWIGKNVKIMSGLKIGSGAIIGANSVVTKDIPPYAVVVGNPAKIIKYRFDEETRKKFMAIKWWNWNLEEVLKNFPVMYNFEDFLEQHYTPEFEIISQDNISSLRGRGGLIISALNLKIFILLLLICILRNLCGINIFRALKEKSICLFGKEF